MQGFLPSHRLWNIFQVAALSVLILGAAPVCRASETTDAIRREALLPSSGSSIGRPLPLAAHWNTGTEHAESFDPAYQLRKIEAGNFLLPWFQMPDSNMHLQDPRWVAYYEAAIRRAAELRLPITLVGTQWDATLYMDPAYLNLPPKDNPNVVREDGFVFQRLSPFGPLGPWHEVGQRWTTGAWMKRLQELYPDPPLVVFVSNNEAQKLEWKDVANDFRWKRDYPQGGDDFFKIKVVGDHWIERYREMQAGMRAGLSSPAWAANSIFVGYDAFGARHFARWWGWWEYGLPTAGRIDPSPLAWDGGSPSYYLYNWQQGSAEYRVMGPEIEAQNWVFMLAEAFRLNPEFWFELSSWDGNEPGSPSDKRRELAASGQTWSPERYEGMINFGLWLLRPRVVRDFRGYRETLLDAEGYFQPIMEAVGKVHGSPVLTEFWRRGQLVANRAHKHPYQNGDFGYDREDRWFLLDTSVDPPANGRSYFTEFPVLALALVLGDAPQRRWLIYAHSPIESREGIVVQLPEFGPVTVDAAQAGSFYVVSEATRTHTAVKFQVDPTLLATTSAASYQPEVSPGSVASIWKAGLTGVDKVTLTVSPEPGSGKQTVHACEVLFTTSNQINLVLPKIDLPPGMGGRLQALRNGQPVGEGWVSLSSAAPALFMASRTGEGIAAGYVIHRDSQNRDTYEPLTDAATGAARPIVQKKDRLFLVLYGTGGEAQPYVDHTAASVCKGQGRKEVWLGDKAVDLLYYGPSGYRGVQQINIDLTGRVGNIPAATLQEVHVTVEDCFGARRSSQTAHVLVGGKP